MNLIYNIKDRPPLFQTLLFALQQVLAIISATITVPMIINNVCGTEMSAAAALFGAGAGTIIYLLFTKNRSPVFLGSSFAFIGSMCAAFAGAASVSIGYAGLIIGAIIAGLIYMIFSLLIKCFGVKWIGALMPQVIIGPVVAIIGLSLASSAISNLSVVPSTGNPKIALLCGIITFLITTIVSVYGKKIGKLIPFIMGILGGYIFSTILYFIGTYANIPSLIIIDYSAFNNLTVFNIPDFTFITGSFKDLSLNYILTLFIAYAPVAFVVFAEHIADHENLSFIIGQNLLVDPGLHRTLLGDGIGSMVGAFFGGCPNTTYGESIGCVAITKNASVISIWCAAIMCIIISFISPIVAFLSTIPSCVMGGVCIALYGFIAVSGLKMIQHVDLNENKNLFVVSAILIPGVGGMALQFGQINITTVACALILGIITNLLLNKKNK